METTILAKALSSNLYLKMIKEASDVEEFQKSLLQTEYERYRDLFLEGSDEICDDEDLNYFIAVKYLEVKADWIQQNLRLNYQAVFKGQADQTLLLKAGLLSHFLGLVEPVVSEKHLGLIQDLLAKKLAA